MNFIEKLEIIIRNANTPDDAVKTIPVESYNGNLIAFHLDSEVKEKTGKVGAFYVKVNAPDLTATNETAELPKVRLKVSDAREIYNAEFAPQNETKTDGKGSLKQTMTDYNQVNYLYAHTRGIPTTEKLDIELWETKRDNAFHRFTGATVDESGLLKVKINWNTIKKKPGMRTVYAKIICQSNNEVLYDAMGKMNKATVMLFNIPSIMTEAGYKSAVMVEGSSIDTKKENEKGICECEARVRAFMRMLRVGEGTGELNKSGSKIDPQLGYTIAFGGNKITDLSTHPMRVYGWSSAAGAYQIMQYTYAWLGGSKLEWTGKYFKILNTYEPEHDYRKKYKINDYRPESQDKLCICLMKDKKGLIELIIKNQIEESIRKYGSAIWASLPYEGDNSRYKDNKGNL